MAYPHNGFTRRTPEKIRQQNLLKSAVAQLEVQPDNIYWQNRRNQAAEYIFGENWRDNERVVATIGK